MTAPTRTIAVRRLPHGEGLDLPSYATEGAAGMDLLAAVTEPITLPPGHELQVRPRSGLALKHGITLPNSPGTIDEDYRGELQIIVMNAGDAPFEIMRGMRIAQGVLAPVLRATWEEVDTLPETMRAQGGFGSTGH